MKSYHRRYSEDYEKITNFLIGLLALLLGIGIPFVIGILFY